jgi:hypothetical protein
LHKDSKRNIWFWGGIFTLILFAGLRAPGNYTDLDGYEVLYKTGEPIDYGFGTDSVNVGYQTVNDFLNRLGIPFQFFLFVIAFWIYFLFGKFISKYSPDILLSLCIFYLIDFSFSLVLLRQFIAVSIGLLSFKYVIERKQIEFIICCLLALSFHSTSIVLFPIYYIYGIKTTRRNIIILLALTIGTTIAFNIITNFMASFTEYYANYIGKETESSVARTLMKTYILLVFIMALGKDVFLKNINFLLLICLVLNVVIYIGGTEVFGLYRLRTYFEISEIIGIPVILRYAKRKPPFLKLSLTTMTFVYGILLFITFLRMVDNEDIFYNKTYSLFF